MIHTRIYRKLPEILTNRISVTNFRSAHAFQQKRLIGEHAKLRLNRTISELETEILEDAQDRFTTDILKATVSNNAQNRKYPLDRFWFTHPEESTSRSLHLMSQTSLLKSLRDIRDDELLKEKSDISKIFYTMHDHIDAYVRNYITSHSEYPVTFIQLSVRIYFINEMISDEIERFFIPDFRSKKLFLKEYLELEEVNSRIESEICLPFLLSENTDKSE